MAYSNEPNETRSMQVAGALDDLGAEDEDNSGGDDDGAADASDAGGDDGAGGSGKSGGAIPSERPDGGHDRVVRNEVVVADADASLSAFAKGEGFRVLHSEQLAALGVTVTRLQAPAGVSARAAPW